MDEQRAQAIAYLCQQLGGFLQGPSAEQRLFLETIGVPAADIDRVLPLLEQMAARSNQTRGARHGARDALRGGLHRFNLARPFGPFVHGLPGWIRCQVFVQRALRPRAVQWIRALACPIGWQPSVVAPVFHGIADYGPADGAPGALRVFYPSLGGAVYGADFLASCGQYPLVIFLHGHCTEADHYQRWYQLPSQLARSGFVVVVPRLPDIEGGGSPFTDPDPDLELAAAALWWMRNSWEHQGQLECPPATGIVGHSYGALLGARLATRVDAAAYVSLSGAWTEWTASEWSVLDGVTMPSLFTWGSNSSDSFAVLEGGNAPLWDRVGTPKHKVAFDGAEHWDYLPESQATCDHHLRGPCHWVGSLAADLAATFVSKYMPPEHWSSLTTAIGNNLLPPANWRGQLTLEQEFLAGAHLMGFDLFPMDANCNATHTWRTFGGATGTNSF